MKNRRGVCVSFGRGGGAQCKKMLWGGRGGLGGFYEMEQQKNMYKMENHEYFNIMGRMEGSRYICKVGSRKEVGQI